MRGGYIRGSRALCVSVWQWLSGCVFLLFFSLLRFFALVSRLVLRLVPGRRTDVVVVGRHRRRVDTGRRATRQ